MKRKRKSMFAHHEAFLLSLSGERQLRIDRRGRIWKRAARSTHGRVIGQEYRAENRLWNGYLQVSCTVEGEHYQAMAHRIVWTSVYGQIPDGMTINHLNGKKDDNRLCNLELVTQSENMLHAFRVLRVGNHSHGPSHYMATLTTEQVCEIYRRRVAGECGKLLAQEFGTSPSMVWRLSRGINRFAEIAEHENIARAALAAKEE